MSPSRGRQSCTTPGCDELVTTGKCPACRGVTEIARGTPAERGYDARHRALRQRWAPLVAAGHVECHFCSQPILAGQPWALDHTPRRDGYRGPAHASCNAADGARRGNRSRRR